MFIFVIKQTGFSIFAEKLLRYLVYKSAPRSTEMMSVQCSLYQWPDLQEGLKRLAKKQLDTFADRALNCRVMSVESGGRAGPRNVVQLYEDSVDIGQEMRYMNHLFLDSLNPTYIIRREG